MHDRVYRGLVVVAVVCVRYSLSHYITAHIDGGVDLLTGTKAVRQKGGLEVVESRHWSREESSTCVVGVPDVGPRVVQNQSAVGCCMYRVGAVPGVESYSLVQRIYGGKVKQNNK